MTVSGCGRRSWRLGRRCANGTATATSPGSIGAPWWPRLPELSEQRRAVSRRAVASGTNNAPRSRSTAGELNDWAGRPGWRACPLECLRLVIHSEARLYRIGVDVLLQ